MVKLPFAYKRGSIKK